MAVCTIFFRSIFPAIVNANWRSSLWLKCYETEAWYFNRWGPWLYYRRVEEGKQYPVLCRRKASLHEEFISYSDPSAGFDFTSGKKIEQKIIDYNQEAERFGGS